MKHFFTLIAALSISVIASATIVDTIPIERVNHPSRNLLSVNNHTMGKNGDFIFCSPKPQPRQQGAETVNLTINYESSAAFTPIGISVYNKENGMFHVDYDGKTKTVTQVVPKGTYDMFASYMSSYSELYYVFKENVKIDADATFTLSQSEAKTGISFRTVDQDGNSMHMPVYNNSYQIVEEGTIDDYSSLSFFILKGFGNVAAIIGGGYKFKGHETDFYINHLSERYKLCEARMVSKGEVYWFNKYVLEDFTKDTIITNNPARYIAYNQKFETTPEWKEKTENHVPGYYFSGVYKGDAMIGQQSYIPDMPSSDLTTKFFLDLPKDDDNSEDMFNVLVKPLMGDYMKIETYGDYEYKTFNFIRGQQVMGDRDGLLFVNSGYEENGGYNAPENNVRSQLYPGHPKFSFTDKTASNVVYGASCPVNSLRIVPDIINGKEYLNIIPSYIGRYGELRDADHMLVEQSEQQVSSDVYKIIIENDNVNVDGLEGKNKTELVMMQNESDHIPPTMQMLQFKDKNGNITDCFANPADGVVEIAGGDFSYNPVSDSYSGYYTCGSATIKVTCSPFGKNNTLAIPMEEIRDLYFMPGFGHFFRGSLENIPASMEKQWYDLTVTFTDPSGNNQTQTISPAFCIDGTLAGIDEMQSLQSHVKLVGDMVVVKGFENATMQLLSVDGRLVSTGTDGEIYIGSLPRGVYVVKVFTSGIEQITSKILI
ncbi:T9SS type A sorting domain-containing protein [Prevotella sp. OH937_COT-195]|uniref:T9SS type A sorting domain-containing protein n=1 Tax=Prevotella sp. OH937_COT-195 TaxID=2491051 RepID=UPI000F64C9DD|nr:T9SS type A sorting domain-containing protein [Prevotella sp. OH937_COT-195]RRD02966.1 T9SS C-terminal target domain-containing protein [Prevotella sp. OH937_COT-195]